MLSRGVASGRMSQQLWEIIGYKLPLVAKADSSAGKGIAQRKGAGKVKHLELKERWLQDFVQEGKVQIRKEPASTNMADLGTKALSGPRIHELARMLPLRRGFMAAILASCIQMAGAQPQQQQESYFDIASFWMYVIVLHLLALYGLIQLAGKLARFCRQCCDRTAVATRSVETQTDSHREQVVENPEPSREVAGSPAPKRRAATSTTPSKSSARAVQETTPLNAGGPKSGSPSFLRGFHRVQVPGAGPNGQKGSNSK